MKQLGVLLAALLWLSAGQAFAVTLGSVLTTDNSSGTWGDGIAPEPDCGGILGPCPGIFFDDNSSTSVPNGWSGWNSSASGSVGGGGSNFTANHNYYLATQAQNAIRTTLDYNGSVTYSLDVNALNPLEGWEITINASNVGTVGHTDANAGFIEIADSTSNGTVLALNRTGGTATGDAVFTGASTFGAAANFADTGGSYNQAGTFTISGTGSQTVAFTINFGIDTNILGMFSFGSGDSLCFNGGLGGSPNTDCSVGGGTGIVLGGTILQTSAPEPGVMVLLGAGLTGLAWASRRRS